MTPFPAPAATTAKSAAASLFAGSLLFTAACSASGEAADTADGGEGSGEGPSIVTSTAIWGDVAAAVVDPGTVEITPIVQDQDADPHSFEPSAADMARVENADIIVVGGGGYDAWLYDAVGEDNDAELIHALPLSGGHDHGHDEHSHEGHDHGPAEANEHVWYDPAAVTDVAEQIAAAVNTLDPAAGADATELSGQLATVETALQELPAQRVAQTEPIADHLLAHTAMEEVTPDGYRATSLSHSEPSAADLAAFLELIADGGLDLLIHNPQTMTDLTDRLREEAQNAGVPVVEIRETPPEGENFLGYFSRVVEELAQATGAGSA
ncbi:metal ABC transporter solute-binding protein, Zn/Mn family [Corynebacterium halotolerans]|uniref:ABC transporter substrate-binding protein n=1 Tax=Corynebacterium halotolerans YIM 70093 = DSM 44683 TaxID=1121362 RepID=M1NV89_9CORY|nr:zinc ABC transporter substrate-binding protein [Corynebacterium halotolerans]AGF73407.1 hypothetical protein A605_12055 [Corynebacterium halotolerans YIM 70093 = DSM 44683]